MKPKTEIHAVDLVRHIRDEQAELLQGKSAEEIIAFFRKAGRRPSLAVGGAMRGLANKTLHRMASPRGESSTSDFSPTTTGGLRGNRILAEGTPQPWR